MKKKTFINLSIRLRFIFMIMSELICVSLIFWLVMDVLHISDVPNIVWIILASVIAGGVLNNFLSIRYFGPVLKLKKAMQQVAEGDFSIRLETESRVRTRRLTISLWQVSENSPPNRTYTSRCIRLSRCQSNFPACNLS